MQHAASAIIAPDTDQLPVYWQFHDAVARAQLRQWLPSGATSWSTSPARGTRRRAGRPGRAQR